MSSTVTPPPVVWSIRELLRWTTNYLSEKGLESPRLDAQILLAHSLQCSRIELVARSDEVPPEAQRTAFRELVKRRVAGTPVAYLTGTKEFYLLPFAVSPAVLIPRPDTETLVLEAIQRLKPVAAPRVLDLGTGSGCIATAMAVQLPAARVTAVELSPEALDIARQNVRRHGVADRVTLLHGDLFAPIPPGSMFDAVVSNPPYIAHAELGSLMPDVRDHEPRLALDGGPDGLSFYRRIAGAAAAVLVPGGSLLLEIGAGQGDAIAALFRERPEFTSPQLIRDAGGLPRVFAVKRA